MEIIIFSFDKKIFFLDFEGLEKLLYNGNFDALEMVFL